MCFCQPTESPVNTKIIFSTTDIFTINEEIGSASIHVQGLLVI